MELQTISQFSKQFKISTITLRYYEQIGLIQSITKEDHSYRTYDESLLEIVDSLTTSKINFKEDKTMDDLVKVDEKLSKLTDKDVRIVYLPPSDD